MRVIIMPATATSATVKADGKIVGVIQVVEAPGEFEGYDGAKHSGHRWLPEGIKPEWLTATEGPVSRQDAALMLLALEGHDHEAAMKALGYAA